jgi:hypothetical protein
LAEVAKKQKMVEKLARVDNAVAVPVDFVENFARPRARKWAGPEAPAARIGILAPAPAKGAGGVAGAGGVQPLAILFRVDGLVIKNLVALATAPLEKILVAVVKVLVAVVKVLVAVVKTLVSVVRAVRLAVAVFFSFRAQDGCGGPNPSP